MSRTDKRDLPYGVRIARGLLADFTAQALMATQVNAGYAFGPKKGPRGLRIERKRRRRREHARTLQRNSWRTYFELMKRSA